MPMLVRSPEEIFRVEKKDVYAIHNLEGSSIQDSGMVLIAEWLKTNLPATKTELLGPSENSGFIVGGINGALRVDFTPSGLQMFCNRWEEKDESVDPRFQLCIYPYQKWFQEHGQFVPNMDKPQELGLSVWYHTPLGFIHHQLTLEEADAKGLSNHPANPEDLWMHVGELWPEMAKLKKDDMTFGSIGRDIKKGTWHALFMPPFRWTSHPIFEPPTATQIRDWFCLPADSYVAEDSY